MFSEVTPQLWISISLCLEFGEDLLEGSIEVRSPLRIVELVQTGERDARSSVQFHFHFPLGKFFARRINCDAVDYEAIFAADQRADEIAFQVAEEFRVDVCEPVNRYDRDVSKGFATSKSKRVG